MPKKINITEKVILGIDPGTQILGYGVIKVLGKDLHYIDMGVLNLKKDKDHFVTLKKITQQVNELLDKFMPDELAIEAPFYGKNVQVMLKLGRAQGAAIAAALMRDIPIFEYAPRSIKLSVTGKGAASKEQVALMAQRILNVDIQQKYLDATDALAIALCHHYQSGSILRNIGKSGGWGDFIKNNPDRVY